ncbi:hypothetical protein EJ419_07230 [Alloscardovia theropitheci]|uniref:Uncharacterized protein n=1 Tax=Alloscardovia theropitheci TaxID=2496842 RepID=A0A4R0QWR5_9BIFI|nr:hypothetical protein [Alloscardovia theropitheci]TCD53751.1 hypothetical protein EJ419_07230 [Alloscardovia theropitheci]
MSSTKFTDADLQEMYYKVQANGWDVLSRGEKIALSRYIRKLGLMMPEPQGLTTSVEKARKKPIPHMLNEKKVEILAESANLKKIDPVTESKSFNETVQDFRQESPKSASLSSEVSVDDKSMSIPGEPSSTVVVDGVVLGRFVDSVDTTIIQPLSPVQRYYKSVASTLQKHPLQWLLLDKEYKSVTTARHMASNIRVGRTRTWQSSTGRFEAFAQLADGKNLIAVRLFLQVRRRHRLWLFLM